MTDTIPAPIAKQLLQGEQLRVAVRPHWILLAGGMAVDIVGVILFAVLIPFGYWWAGLAVMAVGFMLMVPAVLRRASTWYVVTDRRVFALGGLLGRASNDTMLDKLEAVQVEEGAFGRMLGYGTVTVVGSGGTREQFSPVPDPQAFRRAVQERASR